MLATRLMQDQGIHVQALHIRTGFSYVERNRIAGRLPQELSDAERAAAQLGLDLEIIDVFDAYVPIVLDPMFGYGSGMNPCADCRIFLLRTARRWMIEHGYDFVFTGEVIGQRPKSQMRPTLRTVERESGLEGLLLRPLSAKLLAPTIPERSSWVDRERLYGISGRGRKAQIALAEELGIEEYAQPSGGCCYLIDQTYARRLRDMLTHEGREFLTRTHVQLLAVGRHLRLPSGVKVVVGRHERENDFIDGCCDVEGVWLRTPEHPGPSALLLGVADESSILLAAQITAGYSDGRSEPEVTVDMRRHCDVSHPVNRLTVTPAGLEVPRAMMV
ncbi:MAG: hypothetical protein GX620_14660 [Chloroflexi bacterium]|nr:hypothetical protein [Chloroflexota bacterium]